MPHTVVEAFKFEVCFRWFLERVCSNEVKVRYADRLWEPVWRFPWRDICPHNVVAGVHCVRGEWFASGRRYVFVFGKVFCVFVDYISNISSFFSFGAFFCIVFQFIYKVCSFLFICFSFVFFFGVSGGKKGGPDLGRVCFSKRGAGPVPVLKTLGLSFFVAFFAIIFLGTFANAFLAFEFSMASFVAIVTSSCETGTFELNCIFLRCRSWGRAVSSVPSATSASSAS